MLKFLRLVFLLLLTACLAPDKGIEVDKKIKAADTTPTKENNVVITNSVNKIVMSGASSVVNGECSLVVINSLDGDYQSLENESALSVALSVTGAGAFYSDSACTTSALNVDIPAHSSSVSVYFQATANGSISLKAQATKFAMALMNVQATSALVTSVPAATKLKINGPQYFMTDVCLPLSLNLLDQNNNSFASLGTTSVALAGMSNFYSNSTCSTGITSINLTSGEFQKMIYTRTSSAGAYVVTATSAGLVGENFPLFASTQVTNTITEYGLQMLGTSLIEEDQCTPVTINLLGSNAAPILATSIKNLTLSGTALSNLYSNSGCTTNLATLGSLSVASGSTSTVFYFKSLSAGNVVLNATSTGLIPASLSLTIKPAPTVAPAIAAAKIKVYGAQNLQTNMCVALNLALQDQNNNSFSSAGSTVVNFSGVSTVYSDAACSSSITSTTLTVGQSSKIFYTRIASAGGYVLTSTSTGLASDYFPMVAIDPPSTASVVESSLQLTGPNQFQATLCAPFNVNLMGSNGAPVNAIANKTVTLSGILLSQVFTDSGCTTNPASLSSLSIPSGSASSVFYMKALTPVNLILGASSAGLIPANLSVLITTAPASNTPIASKIKVYGAQNLQTNMCVGLNLALQDQNNNSFSSVGSTVVNFSGVSTVYSDAACSSSITSTTLTNGQDSKLFYARVTTAGGYVLTSTSTGLSSDYFSMVAIDPPSTASVVESSLQLAGPNQFQATLCAPFNVNLMGSNGAPVLATANKAITLSGISLSQVFSDSGCATNLASLSSLTIPSGAASAVFYLKALTPVNIILGASTSGLIPANLSVLITTAPSSNTPVESKVKLSGAQNLQEGMCAPFNVSLLDQNNNAFAVTAASRVVNLAGVSSVYSDSVCTSTASSVTLTTGESNKIFYVKINTAGGYLLGASSVSVAGDQLPLVVTALPSSPVVAESTLQFSGPSQFSTSLCAPFVVNLLGSNGLPIIAAGAKTITLSGTVLGNFYTDNACSTGLATLSSLSIANGATHAIFYLKMAAPASVILGASSTGLTSATLSALITSTTSAPIEQSMAAQGSNTAEVNECIPLSATVLNSNGVPVAIAANRTVNLSSSNVNLQIFSDPICSSSAASLLMLAGESHLNYYVKGINAGNFMVTLASTGLISANHPVRVVSQGSIPVPYKLYLSTVAQTVHDVCTPAIVSSLDNAGNAINVTANTTVNLSAAGDITYYSNASCTTTTTSVVINNASSMRTFYFKANTGLSAILQASASGLADSFFNLGIVPPSGATGSPVQLRMLGVSGIYTDSCNIFQVQSVDENGVLRNVTADKTVNLGGVGAGSFYSDNACTSTISSTTLTNGTSSRTIYYSNPNVENLLLTASTTGLIGTTFSVVLTANPESLGGFKIEGQQNILTSSCVPYIFTALKNNGGVKTLTANKTFTLNSATGVDWYTNSTCSSAVTTPTIVSGQSNVTYYLKIGAPGNYILSASSSPLNPGVLGVAVTTSSTDIGINFEDVDFRVIESQGAMKLKILLTAPAVSGINIPFTVSGIAARPGDHNLASGFVSISAGQNFGYINFSVVEDAIVESEETIIITLGAAPAGYYRGFNNTLTISIYDNDNGGVSAATSGSRYKKVEVGNNHSCAILEGGTVKCWGNNTYGQLGNGTNTPASPNAPVLVTGLTGVVDLSLGVSSTCALTSAGAVKCWGYNNQGQLGDGTTVNKFTPVDALTLTSGITKIQTGDNTTCALNSLGDLKCWGGTNGYLQSGTAGVVSTPTLVPGISSPVVQFALGPNYSAFALTASGALYSWGYNVNGVYNLGRGVIGTTTIAPGIVISSGVSSLASGKVADTAMCVTMMAGGIKCWGANSYGEVGDGTVAAKGTPTDVLGISSGVSSVYTSSMNTCALMTNGDLRCWGYYSYGIPGEGFAANVTTPSKVLGFEGTISEVFLSDYSVCVLYTSSAMACWGYNGYGQLGDGTNTARMRPTFVEGFSSSGARSVSFAGASSQSQWCAITSSGKIKCWGYNNYGQLGDGTATTRLIPTNILEDVQSMNLKNMASVVSGGDTTCALQTDTQFFGCWGQNNYGQLGNGSSGAGTNSAFTLSEMLLAEKVTQYSLGTLHSCSIVTGGALKCWGYNVYGQLGDGGTTNKEIPTTVPTLSSGVISVAAGQNHSCAVTSAGGAKCWGYNAQYQLGDGSGTQRITPGDVTGLTSGVAKVSAGATGSCAITTLGAARCWGTNPGNASSSVASQVPVTGLTSGVSDIVVGSSFGCALTTSGGVKCWGAGTSGQLGQGVSATVYTPVDVSGLLSGAKAIATSPGASHTCAINSSDNVVCWGNNASGQLGDGTTSLRNAPVAVLGLPPAKSISVGTNHSCAVLLSSGEVRCWGANTNQQLGTGSATAVSGLATVINPVTNDYRIPKIYTGKKHSCMTYLDKLYCWGANTYGQLGRGTTSTYEATAAESIIAYPIDQVALGEEHTCVVFKGGHTSCFGRNNRGQLGDGTGVNKTNVFNFVLKNTANISAGNEFTCANGGVGMRCWGANDDGQLGDGTYTDRQSPTPVLTNKNFNGVIFAGSRSVCANAFGSTYCWGHNGSNQFGLGYNGGTSFNEPVALSMSFRELGLGEDHICGIRNNGDIGTVYCAGYNNYGQLGSNDGDKETFFPVANLPVELKNASKIQVGEYHACVKDEATEKLFCWGRNNYGQLGQSRYPASFSPKYVPGSDATFDFSSSWNHLCFIQKKTSSLSVKPPQCFGYGQDGQLGNNDTTNFDVPVFVQGAP